MRASIGLVVHLRGQIDYKAVRKTAKVVGVKKFYLEDETVAPFETVPQSIR